VMGQRVTWLRCVGGCRSCVARAMVSTSTPCRLHRQAALWMMAPAVLCCPSTSLLLSCAVSMQICHAYILAMQVWLSY
jgi:hypothetical protein